MNDEQKAWSKQYTSNIGVKELLRLGCAFMLWFIFGIGISLAVELAGFHISSIILSIFLISMFVFPIVVFRWKSTYSLLRKILGNNNLPTEPMPPLNIRSLLSARQPLSRWYYVLAIWRWVLFLLLLYAVIKHILK